MMEALRKASSVRGAMLVAVAYGLFAALWMLLFDLVIDRLFDDPQDIPRLQAVKDWGFVAATSLVLFCAVWHRTRVSREHLRRFMEQRAELNLLGQFRESVIDNASIWINVLDVGARVTVWNKAAEQISGYSRKEVLGNPLIWEWLYPDPEYRARIIKTVADILDQGVEVEDFETSIRVKSGEWKSIAWNSRRFFNEQGEIIGSIAIGRDITAYKQAEQRLVERERQLATLMSNLPGMAYRCLYDETWTMKFVSNGCRRLIGYSPEDLVDNHTLSYASMIHEEDLGPLQAEIERALTENRSFTAEYRVRRKDGQDLWVWEQGRAVLVDGRQYLEGIIADISRRKAMERELKLLAIRDVLTGLYNRRHFEQTLRADLDRARRYGRPLSLLLVDVDHFKSINDRFGHQAGDEVLRQLGRVIQSSIRAADYAARYGGEELVVVMPEIEGEEAMTTAERLRGLVQATDMMGEPHGATVTISVGVATHPHHGSTPEEIFEAADRALYLAKQRGRNRVCRAA